MHVLLHPAVLSHLLQELGGVFTAVLGGVTLFIDSSAEICYIETAPEFDMRALQCAEMTANRWGYEVMGEDEGGVEELDGGRVRHWLAQTTFLEEAPPGLTVVAS